MELTIKERSRRCREFPESIRELSLYNPIVSKVMTAYAVGHIATHEEALCGMIIALAEAWEKQLEQNVNLMRLSLAPPVLMLARDSVKEWVKVEGK